MKHIKLFENFVASDYEIDIHQHAKEMIDGDWIDSDDFDASWDSSDFAEYCDNKMNQYNKEVLDNDQEFDNTKGDVLNAIIKYLKADSKFKNLSFLN